MATSAAPVCRMREIGIAEPVNNCWFRTTFQIHGVAKALPRLRLSPQTGQPAGQSVAQHTCDKAAAHLHRGPSTQLTRLRRMPFVTGRTRCCRNEGKINMLPRGAKVAPGC